MARPGPSWVSGGDAAVMMGMGLGNWRNTFAPTLPPEAKRRDGKNVWYNMPDIFDHVRRMEREAVRQEMRKEQTSRGQGEPSEEELLAGGEESAWLEAYRREKTLLARMDREERAGELLKREVVRRALQAFFGEFREWAEIVAAKGDNHLLKAYNDHLHRAAARVRSLVAAALVGLNGTGFEGLDGEVRELAARQLDVLVESLRECLRSGSGEVVMEAQARISALAKSSKQENRVARKGRARRDGRGRKPRTGER